MIRNFVDDIKRAKDNKAYLSALALALTIPDICGKIEYYKTSNMNNRDKYIAWFDKWIYKYVEIPKSKFENFHDYDEMVKFDGEVCYALRNELLHQGNTIDGYNSNGIKFDRFELCVSDSEWQFGDGHGCQLSDGEIIETHRIFNVVNLLECFISGTEDYIDQNGDNSDSLGIIKIQKI